jgi:lipoprotein-releasing system permease protein
VSNVVGPFFGTRVTPLTDWQAVAEGVSKVPGVRLAAPIVEGQALTSSPFNASSVLVRGIRARDLIELTSIAMNIQQGTLDGFDEGEGIVIGSRLAKEHSLQAGGSITLVVPQSAATPTGVMPRVKPCKIAAVFEIGMSKFDSAFVFMPLAEAQSYFDRTDDVTGIEVHLTDADNVAAIRQRITEVAGRPIVVTDWRQRNATYFDTK